MSIRKKTIIATLTTAFILLIILKSIVPKYKEEKSITFFVESIFKFNNIDSVFTANKNLTNWYSINILKGQKPSIYFSSLQNYIDTCGNIISSDSKFWRQPFFIETDSKTGAQFYIVKFWSCKGPKFNFKFFKYNDTYLLKFIDTEIY